METLSQAITTFTTYISPGCFDAQIFPLSGCTFKLHLSFSSSRSWDASSLRLLSNKIYLMSLSWVFCLSALWHKLVVGLQKFLSFWFQCLKFSDQPWKHACLSILLYHAKMLLCQVQGKEANVNAAGMFCAPEIMSCMPESIFVGSFLQFLLRSDHLEDDRESRKEINPLSHSNLESLDITHLASVLPSLSSKNTTFLWRTLVFPLHTKHEARNSLVNLDVLRKRKTGSRWTTWDDDTGLCPSLPLDWKAGPSAPNENGHKVLAVLITSKRKHSLCSCGKWSRN